MLTVDAIECLTNGLLKHVYPFAGKIIYNISVSLQAKEFEKWWRCMKSSGRSTSERQQFLEIKRSDYEKGLERIGRYAGRDAFPAQTLTVLFFHLQLLSASYLISDPTM